jgi:hypothetical protein
LVIDPGAQKAFQPRPLVWYLTQLVIAQKRRVCAFDRDSYVSSDPAPRPQILSNAVDDLHAALNVEAEIARRHRDAVKSVVLVCSFVEPSARLVQYGGLRVEMLEAQMPDPLVGRFLVFAGLSSDFMKVPGVVEAMVATGPQPITKIGLKHQLAAILSFSSRAGQERFDSRRF